MEERFNDILDGLRRLSEGMPGRRDNRREEETPYLGSGDLVKCGACFEVCKFKAEDRE